MTKEKTAYHEAGHAVMAYLVRRRFKYVSIEPDEDSLGQIIYTPFDDNFNPEYDEVAKVKSKLEKVIMTGLAGHAAERIFTGRNNWVGSSADVHNAIGCGSYICGTNEKVEAYTKLLFIRARNKLQNPKNWAAVQALAQELFKNQRIGYMAARKIIREALNKPIR